MTDAPDAPPQTEDVPPSSPEPPQAQASGANMRALVNLLLLTDRLQSQTDMRGIASVLTSDLHILTPCDVAVCWLGQRGRGRVRSVSGLPEPEKQSTFTLWCEGVAKQLSRSDIPNGRISKSELAESLAGDWDSFIPAQALWIVLRTPDGFPYGGLLLARREPWRDGEIRILTRLATAAAVALQAQKGRSRRGLSIRWGRMTAAIGAAGIAAVLALVPVPLSILAPAEVIPLDPEIIRAPLDGVVAELAVTPNSAVSEGDILVRLDDAALKAKLEVARQEYEIAAAEFRRSQQAAGADREASSRLQVLAARVNQKAAELDYVSGQLARILIRAPRSGIAVSPDRDELEGVPVRQGQRLLSIADPNAVKIEAWIPAGDRIPLPDHADIALFLTAVPDTIYTAQVQSIDYQAQPSPSGLLGFRLLGNFSGDTALPSIGLRGSARVSGDRVPLGYFLFRRAWAAVRPWLIF